MRTPVLLATVALLGCSAGDDSGGPAGNPTGGTCDADGPTATYVMRSLYFARSEEGVGWGFDLDGHASAAGDPEGCGKADLTDPEGQGGIDNAFAGLLPTLEQTEAVAVEGLLQDAILGRPAAHGGRARPGRPAERRLRHRGLRAHRGRPGGQRRAAAGRPELPARRRRRPGGGGRRPGRGRDAHRRGHRVHPGAAGPHRRAGHRRQRRRAAHRSARGRRGRRSPPASSAAASPPSTCSTPSTRTSTTPRRSSTP